VAIVVKARYVHNLSPRYTRHCCYLDRSRYLGNYWRKAVPKARPVPAMLLNRPTIAHYKRSENRTHKLYVSLYTYIMYSVVLVSP
jgi:hypothetical protein